MDMIRRLATLCVLILHGACSNGTPSSIESGAVESRPFSTDQLAQFVEATRLDFGLPGLGVLIQIGSDRPLVSVSGVRKRGSEVRVEKSDMWFIGSTAKAMTSTLLATYVEIGSVEFDTTLIEIFPEYTEKFTDAARTITIANLLSHSAGLPSNPADSRDELAELMGDIEDLGQQRKRVLEEFVSRDLLFAPGSDYSYSNTGYIIAAAVIERIGGQSFEILLADRVFEPLGITEFGFGHPASASTEGIIDQPWGHRSSVFRLVPVSPADFERINPPLFNSAGNLHISLENWSIFVADQIKGRAGEGRLFRQQLYERLQMPDDGETGYSLGWGVLVEDGKPIMLTHNGSDGNWFADVRAYPSTKLILLVTTNDGREDDEAKAAAAYIRKEFRRRYDPTP
jgi:CubicO group peptidase (beta-lactamase class C family)